MDDKAHSLFVLFTLLSRGRYPQNPPQFPENNTMEKNKIKEKTLFSIVSVLPLVPSDSINIVP